MLILVKGGIFTVLLLGKNEYNIFTQLLLNPFSRPVWFFQFAPCMFSRNPVQAILRCCLHRCLDVGKVAARLIWPGWILPG